MSDKTELNDKLVSELREIAKSLGIADAGELRKPELIANIVQMEQLIEAARAQQNAVENNYAEIPSAAANDAGEKTRKRIRTVKNSGQPRVEVPLDDTNLFDLQDDEPQTDEAEDIIPATPAAEQEGENAP